MTTKDTEKEIDRFAIEEISYKLKGIGVLVRGMDAYADMYGRSEKGEEETMAAAVIEEALKQCSDRLEQMLERV